MVRKGPKAKKASEQITTKVISPGVAKKPRGRPKKAAAVQPIIVEVPVVAKRRAKKRAPKGERRKVPKSKGIAECLQKHRSLNPTGLRKNGATFLKKTMTIDGYQFRRVLHRDEREKIRAAYRAKHGEEKYNKKYKKFPKKSAAQK